VLQSNLATGGNSKVSALTGSSDFVTVLGQFTSALFKGALVHNKRCHEACNVWLRIGVCSGGFGVMSAQAYTLIVFHVNASATFFTTI